MTLIDNINRTATIPLANVSSHIRPISTNGAADNPEFETSVDTPLGKCRGTLPADAGPEDDLASRVRRLFSTSEALLCSVCYEPYDCTTSGPRAPITAGCCGQSACKDCTINFFVAKQEDTSQKLKRFPCLLCNAPKSLNIEKLTPDYSLIGLLSLVASVPYDLEHELQSFRQVVTLQTKIIKELVSREMSCSETPKREKSDAKIEITDSQLRDALAIGDEIEVLYDGVWCKCFVSSIPSNGVVVSYLSGARQTIWSGDITRCIRRVCSQGDLQLPVASSLPESPDPAPIDPAPETYCCRSCSSKENLDEDIDDLGHFCCVTCWDIYELTETTRADVMDTKLLSSSHTAGSLSFTCVTRRWEWLPQ